MQGCSEFAAGSSPSQKRIIVGDCASKTIEANVIILRLLDLICAVPAKIVKECPRQDGIDVDSVDNGQFRKHLFKVAVF